MKSFKQHIIWQGKQFLKEELVAFLIKRKQQKIEQWEQDILVFAIDWLNDEITTFQVNTSGSTGNPKSISLSREQMKASAKATAFALNLRAGDTALLVLPAQFIAGKMMIVRAIEIGMDLHYYPPQISTFSNIQQSFDFVAIIPLQLQYALENSLEKELYSCKKIIIGGASLHKKYLKQLRFDKSQFFATYGMTETITHIALKDLSKEEDCYYALPGISFEVNEQNCLQITSDRLPQKITKTNDVVDLKSNKSFKLFGRADNIINTGGLKVFPEIWEEQAVDVLDVPCLLTYIDDAKLGQKLVLLIESEESFISKEHILMKLSSIFPSNQLPKIFLYADKLERNSNNKVDRAKNQKMASKLIK